MPATSLGTSDEKKRRIRQRFCQRRTVFTYYPGVCLDSGSTAQERIGATGTTEHYLSDLRPNIGYKETEHKS